MKRNIYFIIGSLIVSLFVYVSCKKENVDLDNLKNECSFSVNKNVSKENIEKVTVFFNEHFKNSKSTDFDLKDIQEIITENDDHAFLVLQEDYDIQNPVNLSIGFYADESGEIIHGMYIQREVIDDMLSVVNYYTCDEILLLSTLVDSENEECFILEQDSKGKVTGQAVIDCISDLYTKRGWLSVAYWVTTALLPETALAATGYCIIAVAADIQ